MVFPLSETTLRGLWNRACRRAGINDLHLHDLRHEGTSRLFELGLNIMEVSAITGHKDLKMLKRYTHLKAQDLALKLAALEEVTPKDDVVETSDDRRVLDDARSKGNSFNMEMIGIKPGSTLVFSKGENITCQVLDRHTVEFEGEGMSLTKSALIIIKRLGYTWDHVAGPQYWMFDNETLYRRRKRMETD